MVDSREKGARAETVARDALRKLTSLKWERTPGSGALHQVHKLKGDLYVPEKNNLFCVEVKHYKDCHIDHSLITGKTPQLIEWWKQCVRQAHQMDKDPLLIFKHDRSKLFVAYEGLPSIEYPYIIVCREGYEFNIALLEDFISFERPKFVL